MGSTLDQRGAEYAATVPLSNKSATIKVSASTSDACVKLDDGWYIASLRGADATCHVYLKWGTADTVAAAEPADTADNGDASGVTVGTTSFRGDQTPVIYVGTDAQYVSYVLSAGATTNKLVFTKLYG